MNRIFLTLGILGLANVFAGINHIESLNSRVETLELAEPQKGVFSKTPPKKELPVEFNEVTFLGEFLYWQTGITGDVYAVTYDSISVPEFGSGAVMDTYVKSKSVGFKYKPGFRLQMNYEMPFDEWGLDLIWTAFSATASSHVSGEEDAGNILPTWDTTNAMSPDYASGKMHENFQSIDLNFGKMFMWSKPFMFRYFAGLKGALVHERLNIIYRGNFVDLAAEENITLKNYFRGIGLNNGVRCAWNLHNGFSFYAKGEAAVLWGGLKEKLTEIITIEETGYPEYKIKANNSITSVKANFVAGAGLNFSFDIGKFMQCALFAGYEFNYWPNQIAWNQVLSNATSLTGGNPSTKQQLGDVGFQGFNFGASMAF